MRKYHSSGLKIVPVKKAVVNSDIEISIGRLENKSFIVRFSRVNSNGQLQTGEAIGRTRREAFFKIKSLIRKYYEEQRIKTSRRFNVIGR